MSELHKWCRELREQGVYIWVRHTRTPDLWYVWYGHRCVGYRLRDEEEATNVVRAVEAMRLFPQEDATTVKAA